MSICHIMNTLKQKLNRANGILAKLRYYVSADEICISNLGSEPKQNNTKCSEQGFKNYKFQKINETI